MRQFFSLGESRKLGFSGSEWALLTIDSVRMKSSLDLQGHLLVGALINASLSRRHFSTAERSHHLWLIGSTVALLLLLGSCFPKTQSSCNYRKSLALCLHVRTVRKKVLIFCRTLFLISKSDVILPSVFSWQGWRSSVPSISLIKMYVSFHLVAFCNKDDRTKGLIL